jgi:hypothetical protein
MTIISDTNRSFGRGRPDDCLSSAAVAESSAKTRLFSRRKQQHEDTATPGRAQCRVAWNAIAGA